MKKQIALIVLDGWGYREEKEHNAIEQAHKPVFDSLWNNYPHLLLDASGESVGLPSGQMGNSEIGHMTIGAGRILDDDFVQINNAILSGEFKQKEVFHKMFEHVKKHDSVLHVAGLVSTGGVHSHSSHLYAFLDLAKENNIKKIAIHVFTDGRDTPPQNGFIYVQELEDYIKKIKVGEIASVSGRLYAMDRDQRWERLALAEEAIFMGKGKTCSFSASAGIKNAYIEDKSDEYLKPFVCLNEKGESYSLNKNDAFFIFNFRPDRVRMISKKILNKVQEDNLCFATMTDYGKDYQTLIAFPLISITNSLGQIISEHNLKQVHIAETEKFAHATYFLNCGQEKPYEGEEQILVQSPKDVLTYDLVPKMSAEKVADTAIEQIQKDIDFIFVNFANADMVGHTANVPALLIAIEEIDFQLGRILVQLEKKGGLALITADHGNAEINIDKNGERHTAHTTSLVPLIITKKDIKLKDKGTLADIAPTILSLFGIEKPKEMTGQNLLINN